jgi:hypothetical protein
MKERVPSKCQGDRTQGLRLAVEGVSLVLDGLRLAVE